MESTDATVEENDDADIHVNGVDVGAQGDAVDSYPDHYGRYGRNACTMG